MSQKSLAEALEKIEQLSKKEWESYQPDGPAEAGAFELWKAFLAGDITAGRIIIERLDGRAEQRSARGKLDSQGAELAKKVGDLLGGK